MKNRKTRKCSEEKREVSRQVVARAVDEYLKNGGEITRLKPEIIDEESRHYRSGNVYQFEF
jgi:hypothetical protein